MEFRSWNIKYWAAMIIEHSYLKSKQITNLHTAVVNTSVRNNIKIFQLTDQKASGSYDMATSLDLYFQTALVSHWLTNRGVIGYNT